MSRAEILAGWAGWVSRQPTAQCVVTSQQVWRYQDLAEEAAGLHSRLGAIQAGTGTEDGPLMVLCADRMRVIVALLACLARCGTFVPVDVRLPPARLAAVATALRPGVILADAAGRDLLAASGAAASVPVLAAESVAPQPWEAGTFLAPGEADSSYVYFTSGTTGGPKGIRGSFAAVWHFIRWEIEQFGVDPGTGVSQLTSPGFDAFLRDVLVPLCAGGSIHISSGEEPLAGAALAHWLQDRRIALLHAVPTTFRTLQAAGLGPASLPALQTVLLAGEPLLVSDVAWWRGLFGDGKKLVNLYGPSETTMTKVFHQVTAADAEAEVVPAGKPMPGVTVRVLAEPDAAAGTIGEVEIETPFRLGGYLGSAAGGFVGTHRYRTGDLGRIRADGNLEILGRRDQQVKVNGVRIELTEIENVLRSHPQVRDVCTAAMDNGAGQPVLCAYVVLYPGGAELPDSGLDAHAAAGLAPGCRPTVYVRLSSLPQTLTGKVDRRALPSLAAIALTKHRQDPRPGLEQEIATLWTELLSVPAVGRLDDFTLLGGDSLRIARLLDRLRTRYRVEVPIQKFADDPTVAGLAVAVAAARGEDR